MRNILLLVCKVPELNHGPVQNFDFLVVGENVKLVVDAGIN